MNPDGEAYQRATQSIREARGHIGDVQEKTPGDYLVLAALGIFEEFVQRKYEADSVEEDE